MFVGTLYFSSFFDGFGTGTSRDDDNHQKLGKNRSGAQMGATFRFLLEMRSGGICYYKILLFWILLLFLE